MTGWIGITRKHALGKHDLFKDEPFTEREAWTWIIANAAWEDTTHRVSGQRTPVPRGSFICTLRELQSAWGWGSDTRVRKFLSKLETEGMIERTAVGEKNARKTHVTVCKYEQYQNGEKKKTHEKRAEERSENALNKQDNNKQTSEAKASSEKVTDRDQGFSEFWAIWPNRVSKKNAITAWRKLSIDKRRRAYVAVRDGWYERWRRSKPDANPIHAASFLNGSRWEDEFTQPNLRPIDGGKAKNAKRPIADYFDDSHPEMDCGPDRNPSQPLLPASDGRTDSGGCDARLDQGPVWLFSGTDQRCL